MIFIIKKKSPIKQSKNKKPRSKNQKISQSNNSNMRSLLLRNFSYIINNARKVSNDTFLMYHPNRINKFESSKCYDGYLNCGPVCLAVHHLLRKNKIDSHVFKARSGFGDYIDDHVFIYSDRTLIDPTYKQFLRDTRGTDDTYQKFIYEDLDKFFVGDLKSLEEIYKNAKLINKITYKDYNLVELDDLNYYWANPIDITYKFDEGIKMITDDNSLLDEENESSLLPYLI